MEEPEGGELETELHGAWSLQENPWPPWVLLAETLPSLSRGAESPQAGCSCVNSASLTFHLGSRVNHVLWG